MHNVRRIWTIALVVVLVFATAGCVKVRRKATFARTTSPVVYEDYVAVDDWSEWAAEIANHVAKAIKDRPDLAGKPIYMRPLNDRAFDTGFYSLLHTELISRGLQVAVQREEDMIQLSYATLPVSTDRGELMQASSDTHLIGTSGADTLEGRGSSKNSSAQLYDKTGSDEDKAVILSVGMSYNNRYVMHASSVLRVAEDQQANFVSPYERGYQVEEFPARTIKVTGE
ncbi:hypothetical protein [Halodesulfovibrio marinisediminis]|uniref:Uncharacterized protein n=1 Tax=Halodesulfovibrio marinisediminis DSM 17456 TaxID=1121457 RepID=A0A1N6IET2_9BACT|nr:hypothetical protein [Halodesulfovibrio marinisediminis]SIO30532.1 hypothetical protein SAMN02745161_2679 [Halodesulfovibrio marinisediminis DSM 17456]